MLTPNVSGPPTVARGLRSGIRQLVRYDLEPKSQEWTFRLRFHLKPARGATQADLTSVTDAVTAAADQYLNTRRVRQYVDDGSAAAASPSKEVWVSNGGYVLPGTDARMVVEVEFVEDPGDAHAVIEVGPGTPGPGNRMNQVRWFAGAPLHAFAHELWHFLGVRDTHGAPRALLRPAGPPAAARPGDLMGNVSAEEDSYVVLDDHLAQIVEVAAPHLQSRPDLVRPGGHRPHHAADERDWAFDLPPEISQELLVAEDHGLIVETEPGLVVYRAVDTEPSEVFEHGLPPGDLGNMTSIHVHVETGGTQFVSTTLDREYRHDNRRYIYTIHSSESGIDVAKTLAARGLRYWFSEEKEVSFTGTIPREDIFLVRDMETGEVTHNPNYRPRD